MVAGSKAMVGDPVAAGKFNQGFHKLTWVIDSQLATGIVQNIQVPITATHTIVEVHARVATAPVGAAIRLDVLKNGTSIHAADGDKCTIAAGQHQGATSVFSDDTLADGDYLELEIEQVGSSTPGTGLVCVVELE
jgi:hypothetical protein